MHARTYVTATFIAMTCWMAGCAVPHTTLRSALDLSIWTPINPQTVCSAARAKFPSGTARAELYARLPAAVHADIPATIFWPWWDLFFVENEEQIRISSGDYVSIFGCSQIVVAFSFDHDRLTTVRARREVFRNGEWSQVGEAAEQ